MNEIRITVHGNVVTEPVERTGRNDTVFTTFRVASTPRRRTADGRYVDGDTSFFSVIAFSALAANAAAVLRKGQPVIVEGTFALKEYVGSDGQARQAGEIDAAHIGHDLAWGRASFERLSRAAALGHDRTSDPEIRADLRALSAGEVPADHPADSTDGSTDDSTGRPGWVDDDGVLRDGVGADGEVLAGVHGRDHDGGLGDPETDPYDVEPVSA